MVAISRIHTLQASLCNSPVSPYTYVPLRRTKLGAGATTCLVATGTHSLSVTCACSIQNQPQQLGGGPLVFSILT